MTEITWKNPPTASAPGRAKYDHAAITSALRDRPGDWVLLASETTSSALAHQVRNGTLKHYRPAGSFEAASRTVGKSGDGRPVLDIYVRYVGHPADA